VNANSARVEERRLRALRCAAAGRDERLANWLALIALLALGIVWQ
jgi:hypothetical protein